MPFAGEAALPIFGLISTDLPFSVLKSRDRRALLALRKALGYE